MIKGKNMDVSISNSLGHLPYANPLLCYSATEWITRYLNLNLCQKTILWTLGLYILSQSSDALRSFVADGTVLWEQVFHPLFLAWMRYLSVTGNRIHSDFIITKQLHGNHPWESHGKNKQTLQVAHEKNLSSCIEVSVESLNKLTCYLMYNIYLHISNMSISIYL